MSNSLRKELKDQVLKELNQEDDNFKKRLIFSSLDDLKVVLSNVRPGCFAEVEKYFKERDLGIEAGQQKWAAIIEGKVPPNVRYEDSDQSPVYGMDGVRLIEE